MRSQDESGELCCERGPNYGLVEDHFIFFRYRLRWTWLLTAGQALNVKLEDLASWMIYGSSQPVDIATYLLRFVNGCPHFIRYRLCASATTACGIGFEEFCIPLSSSRANCRALVL